MKKISFALTLLIGFNCFAGGSTTGTLDLMMNKKYDSAFALGEADRVVTMPSSQVYYLKNNRAEVQFAINKEGSRKVEIHSLRAEEITNSALVEGIKRSQQTKKWEFIKAPSVTEIQDAVKLNKDFSNK